MKIKTQAINCTETLFDLASLAVVASASAEDVGSRPHGKEDRPLVTDCKHTVGAPSQAKKDKAPEKHRAKGWTSADYRRRQVKATGTVRCEVRVSSGIAKWVHTHCGPGRTHRTIQAGLSALLEAGLTRIEQGAGSEKMMPPDANGAC